MSRSTFLFLLFGLISMQYGCDLSAQGTSDTYENIEVSDFDKIRQDNPSAIILDVRTPGEISRGKIEGAIEMDFYNANFSEKLKSIDAKATCIVYCQSGVRSAKAAEMLAKQGCSAAYNLKGGYAAWKRAGR